MYVYGIIQSCTTQEKADYVFLIDGNVVGNYSYSELQCPGVFLYNVLLYHTTTIPAGTHSFVFQNGGPANVSATLAMLDYLVYTTCVLRLC